MTSKQQVKQVLELALSMAESLGPLTQAEAQEYFELLGEINKVFSKTADPEAHTVTINKKHPIDTLLKKGKVELSERRYQQLIQIYDQIQIMGVKFISAKQNSYATWFPLEINGDKTAALYLTGGGEWVVEPISHKAHGELSGEWEGFDLTEFMAMNCPEFDQDDY